jgi:hypothetical protein
VVRVGELGPKGCDGLFVLPELVFCYG